MGNLFFSPGYNAWRGNAFEILCLNHVKEIQSALGISGVEVNVYAWHSKKTNPAAQIDLMIDRKDGIINLCEMKYSDKPFVIDQDVEDNLVYKREAFREEEKPDKALHITMISAAGVKDNKYKAVAQQIINGEDLFL